MNLRSDQRSQVDRAIDRVEARGHQKGYTRLPLMLTPHSWPPDADVTLAAPDDPDDPVLLIWEPHELAWRWIQLPSGSQWRIAAATPVPWWRRWFSR